MGALMKYDVDVIRSCARDVRIRKKSKCSTYLRNTHPNVYVYVHENSCLHPNVTDSEHDLPLK